MSQAYATCLSIRLLDVYRLNYFIACNRNTNFCICDIDELLRLMSNDAGYRQGNLSSGGRFGSQQHAIQYNNT